ncbi:hypothetical protein N431DRAFT_382690 [Stipitochalara longipes BDJ]|nr:hypothetical protein N431DRAFT_382690 [Stipitochalara longipes BDJ]
MSSHNQYTIARKAVGSNGPTHLPEPQSYRSEDVKSHVPGRGGGLYWKAYTTMVSSLFCGMLLALGHHLFYISLNGKPVGAPQHIIRGVTRQQLNLTLGTLFAFLVKACLAVAITTAYTQIFWRAVKKRSTRLTTIDTIYYGPTNLWSLLSFSVWRKYPLLLLLALTVWLVPIASIVTPAALTVAVSPTIPAPSNMARVPNVDFLSLNFANLLFHGGDSALSYTGPKNAVIRVVAATSAQGSILPISPQAPNSSWVLNFAGPSIDCTNVQGSALDDIKKNIQTVIAIDNCSTSFGYIGWTPSYTDFNNPKLLTLPFILSQNNTSYTFQGGSLGPLPVNLGFEAGPIPATFYAATFPNMTYNGGQLSPANCHQDLNPLPNATVVQCTLCNTSYQASFSFINGEQTVNVTQAETLYNMVKPYSTLAGDEDYAIFSNYSANGTVIPNSWNTTKAQTLSYQAVMDSLGHILVGTIYNSWPDGALVSNSTSVMSTILGEAEELTWLDSYPGYFRGLPMTFQQLSDQSPGQYWNGVDSVNDTQSTIPFKELLESLFQNITIGLMTSKLLQPNPSSPYAPPLTNVTLPFYQTVYVYTPLKLWVAYGLATLFATIAVLIGLLAMFSNGITYSNQFSTILRTARYSQMKTAILPEDSDGKDPLPEYLARASVTFSDGHSSPDNCGLSGVDMKSPSVTSRLLSTASNNSG